MISFSRFIGNAYNGWAMSKARSSCAICICCVVGSSLGARAVDKDDSELPVGEGGAGVFDANVRNTELLFSSVPIVDDAKGEHTLSPLRVTFCLLLDVYIRALSDPRWSPRSLTRCPVLVSTSRREQVLDAYSNSFCFHCNMYLRPARRRLRFRILPQSRSSVSLWNMLRDIHTGILRPGKGLIVR